MRMGLERGGGGGTAKSGLARTPFAFWAAALAAGRGADFFLRLTLRRFFLTVLRATIMVSDMVADLPAEAAPAGAEPFPAGEAMAARGGQAMKSAASAATDIIVARPHMFGNANGLRPGLATMAMNYPLAQLNWRCAER
jgi:hypothetical protein